MGVSLIPFVTHFAVPFLNSIKALSILSERGYISHLQFLLGRLPETQFRKKAERKACGFFFSRDGHLSLLQEILQEEDSFVFVQELDHYYEIAACQGHTVFGSEVQLF